MSVPVAPMDDLVRRVVVEKLSRPDAADLIAAPVTGGVAALRAELATCRRRRSLSLADTAGWHSGFVFSRARKTTGVVTLSSISPG